MAPAGSHILPRESESGTSGNLTTGAIAGIACGAGALFLGAGSLFLVYWRRQRRFDREDSLYEEALDERRPPGAMAPAVTYTLDYKMDDPHHHEGDHGSSYTYSPEKPSHPLSTLSAVETASAMPTHPAYIPRAFVRGSSTRGGSTPSHRSTATTSPPPFPSPPYPASWNSKTQPDDTVIQAYLNVAAAAQGPAAGSTSGTQNQENLPQGSDSSFSGRLPVQPHPFGTRQSPTEIPAVVIPSFTSPPHSASSTDATSQGQSQRKPRAYLPPRLNLSGGGQQDKPLSGRENTTISGPLAFPQHYQGPPLGRGRSGWTREEGGGDGGDDDDADGDDARVGTQSDSRRTFRSRALSGRNQGGGGGGGGDGRGEKGKKHGRKRSDKRNSGGNRHYAEIEIGRDSDIW